MWPDAVRRILRKLETMNGGIIGLVGLQGVGKSSTLQAILRETILMEEQAYRKAHEESKGEPRIKRENGKILLKSRRSSELFATLLDGTHEASRDFLDEYRTALSEELLSHSIPTDPSLMNNPGSIEIDCAEKMLGKTASKQLRQITWLDMLRKKRTILIDTPDYSKTIDG